MMLLLQHDQLLFVQKSNGMGKGEKKNGRNAQRREVK